MASLLALRVYSFQHQNNMLVTIMRATENEFVSQPFIDCSLLASSEYPPFLFLNQHSRLKRKLGPPFSPLFQAILRPILLDPCVVTQTVA